MDNENYNPDWKIEESMNKLKQEWDDSPPMHLYFWLSEAYPEVFKQWQAVYDIESKD